MRHRGRILRTLLSWGIGLAGCTVANPDLVTGADLAGADLSSTGPDLRTIPGDGPVGDDLSGGGQPDLSQAGADMNGGGVTPDEACAALAMATCKALETCSSHLLKITYGDVATCQARIDLLCPSRLKAAGTTATPEKVAACASALGAASCDDFLSDDVALLGDNVTACQAEGGPLAAGAVCGADGQCASTYCQLGNNGCGKCAARAAEGAICRSTAECAYGLLCAFGVSPLGACKKLGAAGDACGPGAPCALSLTCQAGKCATPAGLGDPCSLMQGEVCDLNHGLACNRLTRHCEAVTYAKAGDGCRTGNTYCVASESCSFNGFTCQATAADGAACGTGLGGNGANCLPPALCENSGVMSRLCKVPDPAACK